MSNVKQLNICSTENSPYCSYYGAHLDKFNPVGMIDIVNMLLKKNNQEEKPEDGRSRKRMPIFNTPIMDKIEKFLNK